MRTTLLCILLILTTAASAQDAPDPPRRQATLDEAIVVFIDRAQRNPRDFISRTHLASLYIRRAQQTGDGDAWARAEAAARDALTIKPDHAAASALLATVLSAQHQFVDALAIASAAQEQSPHNLTAIAAVADAQLELGRYADAASTLELLGQKSDAPPVLVRLARLHELRGEDAQARERAAAALEQMRRRPGAVDTEIAWYAFRLGDLYSKAGRVDDAAALLAESHEMAPGRHGTIIALARARQAQGRHPEAIALLQALVRDEPAVDHWGELSDAYRLAGRDAEADHALAQALALARDPDQPQAERRHVVQFLADHGLETDRAVALAEQDLAQRQDIYTHDALAWALYRAGQFDRARQHSEQALRLGSNDTMLHLHAGLIALEVGALDSARQHLRFVNDHCPHFHPYQTRNLAAILAELD